MYDTKSIEDTIQDIIQNTSKKFALHLESLNGTIPLNLQLPDGGLPGQRVDTEMIRWNFSAKIICCGGKFLGYYRL
ncbi:hypothetical protein CHS0354_002599 [Potamilus streckersoni]|uniref:Uncharacterized protein n=1 Tax=Potamilus streckersoni TaxID=2493646 RepID=A0AAE0RNS5_9BIVA|nr:hypothetical protein CHS0354_002599 [Potamilus streckersoni]